MTRRSLASCGLVAGPLAHSTACARDAGNGVTRSQGVSTKAMGRRCLTFQQSTFFVMICCGETNFFCSIVHHPRSVLGMFRDTAVLVISLQSHTPSSNCTEPLPPRTFRLCCGGASCLGTSCCVSGALVACCAVCTNVSVAPEHTTWRRAVFHGFRAR